MTVLNSLLSHHPDLLDADADAAAREIARRNDAARDFAFPDSMTELEAQSGFLLFEREFCARPVHLFGQDIPSIAHTRIRVFRAKGDGIGPMDVGEEILSARISEKSLTEAILSVGGSSTGAPVTVTRLGDFLLPEFQPSKPHAERVSEAHRERHDHEIAKALKKIHTLLDSGLTRSNPDLRTSIDALFFQIRNASDTSFLLERHLQATNTQREEILTEAAYTALHAGRVADGLSAAAVQIGHHVDPDWEQICAQHPMVHQSLDPVHDIGRDAVGRLLVAEIERLSDANPNLRSWIVEDPAGNPLVRFPSDGGISSAVAWGHDWEEIKAWVAQLSRLSNHFFNPHLHDARASRHPVQGAFRASRRHGWTGDIHASFPPDTSDFFTLAVAAAHPEDGLRAESLHVDTTPLVELEMVNQDLMTALRGHPEGLPVPCSIRSLCGIWRRQAPRPRSILDEKISENEEAVAKLPEVQSLFATIDRLKALAASKRTGKGWRAELADHLGDIEDQLPTVRAAIEHHLAEGRTLVEAEVEASTRQVLASISRSLPPGFAEILRIGDA